MHHPDKFHADWSNRCGDMAVFLIFYVVIRPPSWIFKIWKF